jgi:hypothetical protein
MSTEQPLDLAAIRARADYRGAPRPFALYRRSDSTGISGTGVVAEGCAFNDGSAVLRWLSDWPTSVVFHDRGMEAIEKVHGHSGATQVVWMSDELQPLAEMEQERDQARAGQRTIPSQPQPDSGPGWDRGRVQLMADAIEKSVRLNVECWHSADAAGQLRALLAERDRLRHRLADSIDPATIPDQQAKNWADWHPEKYCHRCGQPNICWYADSAIWNEVHGGSGPIWCPVCFARAYEQTTARRVSWRLAPAERSDQVGHLIRSEAAMRHERDTARAEMAWVTAERDRLERLTAADRETMARLGAGQDAARADLDAALVTIAALRDELATARRDAAADALAVFAVHVRGSGLIPLAIVAERWAAEVRIGQRTISPQSATTGEEPDHG